MDDGDDAKPETPYFGLDLRALSLAEFWRAQPWWLFFSGLAIKVLRIEVPVFQAVPLSQTLIELDPDDLPDAAQRLRPTVAELQQLGLELEFYYREDIVMPASDGAAAVLLTPDARTYAWAYVVVSGAGEKLTEQRWVSFVSRLDRRTVVTSDRHGVMDTPAEIDGEVVKGPLAVAHARHLERIAGGQQDAYRGSPEAAVFDREALRRFVLALSRRAVEHGVARGIYKPLHTDQVTALRRGTPTALAKRPSPALTLLVWVVVALLVVLIVLL